MAIKLTTTDIVNTIPDHYLIKADVEDGEERAEDEPQRRVSVPFRVSCRTLCHAAHSSTSSSESISVISSAHMSSTKMISSSKCMVQRY